MTKNWALNIDIKYRKPLLQRKLDNEMDVKDSVMQALDIYLLPEVQQLVAEHGEQSLQVLAKLLRESRS